MLELKIQNVNKSYGEVDVLKDINLEIGASEKVVMLGASGSGKSTLLYLLGGLDKPSSGKIIVNNQDISQFNDDQLSRYRNELVGFIFQFHFLLPSMNAIQNILLPAQIGGHKVKKVKQQVLKMAEILKVDHLLKKYPHELSGGEQQRINILRALSLKPALLLCDEPTGNLDSKNSEIVLNLILSLVEATGSTLVLVTHNTSLASRINRKISIEDGQIFR
ncbi:ABC transporter ATP-binding protein [Bacteriovoracaceae bacterium]|nr:ABC transporter ATP-binding protein [Bacteriovoracaceae bacterium]